MKQQEEPTTSNLQAIAQELAPLVRQAGDVVRSYRGSSLKRSYKKPGEGFVTEADLASEAYLKKALSALLPADYRGRPCFMAEESGIDGDGDWCWVIDPLDGTNNFSHDMPHFCISVALTYKTIPHIGCVYQPVTDELFLGVRGNGATCNGKTIQVRHPNGLKDAVIGVSFAYEMPAFVNYIGTLATHCYALRALGSGALDLAYVAAGRLDGFILKGRSWWDVAAGSLIVQEAGGYAFDHDGSAVTPDFTWCIAGSSVVAKELLDLKLNTGASH